MVRLALPLGSPRQCIMHCVVSLPPAQVHACAGASRDPLCSCQQVKCIPLVICWSLHRVCWPEYATSYCHRHLVPLFKPDCSPLPASMCCRQPGGRAMPAPELLPAANTTKSAAPACLPLYIRASSASAETSC